MPIQTRTKLKSWFVNGAKPVEGQFADWIDSFRHMSEKIAVEDLANGLLEIINGLPSAESIEAVLAGLTGKADLDPETGKLMESQVPDSLRPTQVELSEPGSFLLPAGSLLETMVIIPSEDMFLSIGTTADGEEISPYMQYPGNVAQVVAVGFYAVSEVSVYLSGVTASIILKLYKR